MENLLALNTFSEFQTIDQQLQNTWETYLSSKHTPTTLRPIIYNSWKRCENIKVDPLRTHAKNVFDESYLSQQKIRNKLLIEAAKPVIDDVFTKIQDENLLVVLCDNRGVIIHGKANSKAWSVAGHQYFFIGADWSEESAGTNAIGTALVEQKAVQVFSAEHFCQGSHPWVCSAAPIHDPFTKQVLGVIDLTGEKDLVKAHDLLFVISQAKKIEQLYQNRVIDENSIIIQSMLNHLQSPFVITDPKGHVLRTNTVAERTLQIKKGKSIFLNIKPCHQHINVNDLLVKNGKEKVEALDGSKWIAYFYPYRSAGYLVGGMVVFQKEKVISRVQRSQNVSRYHFSDIKTCDANFRNTLYLAEKAALSDKTILITGETGTGKELVAQSIHSHSKRKDGPFLAVNCGAIPKELIASELFGYDRGTFTGASSEGKKGKFLLANHGTLFLDEIGDLPISLQVYLLRVLEEGSVFPLGAKEPVPVDVRIIAATHKDLRKEIQKGSFREDLYYRLNVIHLHLPPLRERKKDIPILVRHFLTREAGQKEIDPVVLEILQNYHWPGNVRELKNVVSQMTFNAKETIRVEHIPKEILHSQVPGREFKRYPRKKRVSKDDILLAVKEARGNISEAARLLGVSRMTVYRKLND